jgi:hypothetical protein
VSEGAVAFDIVIGFADKVEVNEMVVVVVHILDIVHGNICKLLMTDFHFRYPKAA